jgi:hypothetical protein
MKKKSKKCGNEGIVYYKHNPNPEYYCKCIRWISFDKFSDIEYLAKGCFGEVYKATCKNYCYYKRNIEKEMLIVLKRIYNSDDKIVDVLKNGKV